MFWGKRTIHNTTIMDTFAESNNIVLAKGQGTAVLAAFSLIISFFLSLKDYTSPVVEPINDTGLRDILVLGISILQVLISGVLILNLIS